MCSFVCDSQVSAVSYFPAAVWRQVCGRFLLSAGFCGVFVADVYDAAFRLRLWRAGFCEGRVFMVLPRVFFVRSPLVCFGFFWAAVLFAFGLYSGAFSRCCFCVFFGGEESGRFRCGCW